jgi:hypothetical protein
MQHDKKSTSNETLLDDFPQWMMTTAGGFHSIFSLRHVVSAMRNKVSVI